MHIALVNGQQGVRRVAEEMTPVRNNRWSLHHFDSLQDFTRDAASLRPAAVLLQCSAQLRMRGRQYEAMVRFLRPSPLLVLFDADALDHLLPFVMAGAHGCLFLPASPAALSSAVSTVLRGDPFLCSRAQALVMSCLQQSVPARKSTALTRRECAVLRHLATGLTNKEIGEHLGISAPTVHSHLAHIFKKLGVHRRDHALRVFWGGVKR